MEHARFVCRVFTTKTTPGHGLLRKNLELLTYNMLVVIYYISTQKRGLYVPIQFFNSLALLCRMKKE